MSCRAQPPGLPCGHLQMISIEELTTISSGGHDWFRSVEIEFQSFRIMKRSDRCVHPVILTASEFQTNCWMKTIGRRFNPLWLENHLYG